MTKRSAHAPALISALLFLITASFAHGAPAGEGTGDRVQVDLPSQTLRESLNALASLTGLQILWSAEELPASLKAPRIEGMLTPQAALEALLKNTGLHYDFLDKATVAITSKKIALNAGTEKTAALRLAQNAGTASTATGEATDPSTPGPQKETDASIAAPIAESSSKLEEVWVTGSRIRTDLGEPSFSPMVTFT